MTSASAGHRTNDCAAAGKLSLVKTEEKKVRSTFFKDINKHLQKKTKTNKPYIDIPVAEMSKKKQNKPTLPPHTHTHANTQINNNPTQQQLTVFR